MSFFSTIKKPADQSTPPPVYIPHEEEIMPYEVYNFIIFKCFDACVANFNNKVLDVNERNCVGECIANIKNAPESFQKT